MFDISYPVSSIAGGVLDLARRSGRMLLAGLLVAGLALAGLAGRDEAQANATIAALAEIAAKSRLAAQEARPVKITSATATILGLVPADLVQDREAGRRLVAPWGGALSVEGSLPAGPVQVTWFDLPEGVCRALLRQHRLLSSLASRVEAVDARGGDWLRGRTETSCGDPERRRRIVFKLGLS